MISQAQLQVGPPDSPKQNSRAGELRDLVQGRGFGPARVRRRPKSGSDWMSVPAYTVACRGVGPQARDRGKVPGEASERLRAAWLCLEAGPRPLGDALGAGPWPADVSRARGGGASQRDSRLAEASAQARGTRGAERVGAARTRRGRTGKG